MNEWYNALFEYFVDHFNRLLEDLAALRVVQRTSSDVADNHRIDIERRCIAILFHFFKLCKMLEWPPLKCGFMQRVSPGRPADMHMSVHVHLYTGSAGRSTARERPTLGSLASESSRAQAHRMHLPRQRTEPRQDYFEYRVSKGMTKCRP